MLELPWVILILFLLFLHFLDDLHFMPSSTSYIENIVATTDMTETKPKEELEKLYNIHKPFLNNLVIGRQNEKMDLKFCMHHGTGLTWKVKPSRFGLTTGKVREIEITAECDSECFCHFAQGLTYDTVKKEVRSFELEKQAEYKEFQAARALIEKAEKEKSDAKAKQKRNKARKIPRKAAKG